MIKYNLHRMDKDENRNLDEFLCKRNAVVEDIFRILCLFPFFIRHRLIRH